MKPQEQIWHFMLSKNNWDISFKNSNALNDSCQNVVFYEYIEASGKDVITPDVLEWIMFCIRWGSHMIVESIISNQNFLALLAPWHFSPCFPPSPILLASFSLLIGKSYLAEQFRQITHYWAEQFRQITHYLAEQFRQIAHYLAEHLIQKDDILFNEKFLTL